MSTLDDWLVRASHSLYLNADAISADLRNELLDLTRDVAHGVARVAGPLTCYLVGVAVGRGQSPSAALAAVTALLADTNSPDNHSVNENSADNSGAADKARDDHGAADPAPAAGTGPQGSKS